MATAYFNGDFVPKDEIRISPDDRGFLFAEGIYEVIRWYQGFFYDMDGHLARMKKNLVEVEIKWPEEDLLPLIARELIKLNDLLNKSALVYVQVTRGAANRTHAFPTPPISPTVYAYAREFFPESNGKESGVSIMLNEDIRWQRCDIKSTALLPNTLLYQKALDKGFYEAGFVRNGLITECTHSNIFFVVNGILFTHPESEFILPGITRKNVIKLAHKAAIPVKEEAIDEKMLDSLQEVFLTNTTGEITPVTRINDTVIGNGVPGPITRIIRTKFYDSICSLKHK